MVQLYQIYKYLLDIAAYLHFDAEPIYQARLANEPQLFN